MNINNKINKPSLSNMFQNIIFILRYYLKYGGSIFFYRSLIVIIETIQLLILLNVTKWILEFIEQNDVQGAIILILIVGIITIIGAVISNYNNYIKDNLVQIDIKTALFIKLLKKIKKIDYINFEMKEFYDEYVRSVMNIDIQPERVLNTTFMLITSLLQIFTLTTVILCIHPVYIIISLIATCVGVLFTEKINRFNYLQFIENTTNQRKMEYTKRMIYQPQFCMDLKLFGGFENYLSHQYTSYADEYKKVLLRYSKKKNTMANMIAISNACLVTVIPWIIMIFSLSKKSITIGDATVIISGMVSLPMKLNSLFKNFNEFKYESMNIDTIKKIFSYPIRLEHEDGKEIDEDITKVGLKQVTFSYQDEDEVVHDINLTIQKGKKIAIVGGNGEGKTTIVKLLQRLYDVKCGEITLNNTDIRCYNTTSLREHIVAMEQNFQIYGFSIAENVFMRKVETEQERSFVWDALEKVGLFNKISKLEQGIDTCITKEFDDSGVYLSGGELQRLVLARIYVSKADVIIMDEPTSAFDPISEDDILNKMLELYDDKIVILISHKLSLVQNVDCIYVLKNHKICEFGKHEELVKNKGYYYEMYHRQAKRYGNASL